MHSLFKYLKRNFERSENRLMQMIIIHVICFFLCLFLQIFVTTESYHQYLSYFSISPTWVALRQKPWVLLTYTFVHPYNHAWDLVVFICNMQLLYILGDMLTRFFNSRKFIVLYFFSSVMAVFTLVFLSTYMPYLQKIGDFPYLVQGLSPVIYGLLAMLTSFAPNFSFLLLLYRIPLSYMTLFFMAVALHCLTQEATTYKGIASLGGALWGCLYFYYLKGVAPPFFEWIFSFFAYLKGFLSTTSGGARTTPKMDQSGDDEISLILDKIAKNGYENLTREEKNRLFEDRKEK